MNVLSKINDVYKEIKPIAKSVISALPGGGYINQGLDFVSGAVDKVAPITNAWIDASDRAKISQYTDKTKRLIGDVGNRLVNSYFDVQVDKEESFPFCRITHFAEFFYISATHCEF